MRQKDDSPLKIAMVGGLAGPDAAAGGVWSVAKEQRRALDTAGCEVSLVGGWLGTPPTVQDLTLIRLRPPFPGAGLRGLYSPHARTQINNSMLGADVAHIHLSRDFLTMTAVAVAASRGVPVVAQAHGMLGPPTKHSTRIFDALRKRQVLPHVSTWLALTEVEHKSLVALGVDPDRIKFIHNAVDRPSQHWKDAGEPQRFAFISRLHKRKQPDVFAAAAIQAFGANTDVRFTIAGPDQGALGEVKRIVAGAPRIFDILGSIDEGQVKKELLRSTALVLPSKGEVAPMIAIEAAAMGVPIILTSDCGLASLFRDRQAALVVEPDVEAVASAMKSMTQSAQLRNRLSANARRLYEEQWSSASLAALLIENYKRVSEPA